MTAVPTLEQLRDALGRVYVQQPNNPLLQRANRVLTAVFARRAELPSAVKLGAARSVALALDAARVGTLSAGETMTLVSDQLDPHRVPSLGWAVAGTLVDAKTGQPIATDPMLSLANQLDSATTALKQGLDDVPLKVANTLDAAYQAVAESASNVVAKAKSALVVPVAATIGVLLAIGYARRGRHAGA